MTATDGAGLLSYIRALRNVIWLEHQDKAALREWKVNAKKAAESEATAGEGDKSPTD